MQLSWNSRAFLKTKKVNFHSVGEKKEASASIFCMSDTAWWAIWTVSGSPKACTRSLGAACTADGCSGASRDLSAHHHPAPGPAVGVGFVSRSLGNRATLHFHTFAWFSFSSLTSHWSVTFLSKLVTDSVFSECSLLYASSSLQSANPDQNNEKPHANRAKQVKSWPYLV